jgi:hypothetical protein
MKGEFPLPGFTEEVRVSRFSPQSGAILKILAAISVFDTGIFWSHQFARQVALVCPYDFDQPESAPPKVECVVPACKPSGTLGVPAPLNAPAAPPGHFYYSMTTIFPRLLP